MSTLLALLVNLNRDPKKSKAVEPGQMNPYTAGKTENAIRIEPGDAEALADMRTFFTGA